MRALIVADDSQAGAPPDGSKARPTGPIPELDRHLHALAAAGFREIVLGTRTADTRLLAAPAEGTRLGLHLLHCNGIGPQGDGVEAALPLLGSGPFALLFAGIRTDYPFTRLRAVKCDWAHVVLVPAQEPVHSADTPNRFLLRGARVTNGAAGPEAPAFGGIAVCHPRLFADGRGSLVQRLRQAARDHLVTAEVWRGSWSALPATG